MSLYNMLHGYNNNALFVLAMLKLKTADCGRFRDAWIDEDGKHLVIFTRNGGGNREEYQGVIDELAKHPNYVNDFDDDFDSTYASIRFSVPSQYQELVEALKPKEKMPSLWDKTQESIKAIEKHYQEKGEAPDAIKPLIEKLEALFKGESEEREIRI